MDRIIAGGLILNKKHIALIVSDCGEITPMATSKLIFVLTRIQAQVQAQHIIQDGKSEGNEKHQHSDTEVIFYKLNR